MQGQCKLCLKVTILNKSHIIPEFMYNKVYNNSPKRFYSLHINLSNNPVSRKKIEQKGIREYLLCNDCESQLSKYEKYFSEKIYCIKKSSEIYSYSNQLFIYEYNEFLFINLSCFFNHYFGGLSFLNPFILLLLRKK
jgi:hypothetical protein